MYKLYLSVLLHFISLQLQQIVIQIKKLMGQMANFVEIKLKCNTHSKYPIHVYVLILHIMQNHVRKISTSNALFLA